MKRYQHWLHWDFKGKRANKYFLDSQKAISDKQKELIKLALKAAFGLKIPIHIMFQINA